MNRKKFKVWVVEAEAFGDRMCVDAFDDEQAARDLVNTLNLNLIKARSAQISAEQNFPGVKLDLKSYPEPVREIVRVLGVYARVSVEVITVVSVRR